MMPFPQALREALMAAFVALMLAIPLIGFRLADTMQGLAIETRFDWVAWGVGAVFVGRLALGLLRGRGRPFGLAVKLPALPPNASTMFALVLGVFALVLPFTPLGDRYTVELAITVLIYVMLGWGLNIVVGLAGLLDLGYVAFYAVGAYSYALFAINFGWSFWLCLPIAGVLAAMFGVMLGFPVLRLRGDYLAIVTLGFGEMIRVILLNWKEFSGGSAGLTSIPRPSFFGFPFTANPEPGETAFHELFGLEYTPLQRIIFLYYLIFALALLTNFFTLRMRKLPIGRAWEALREDEIACRALGINPTNVKLSAFALGAMFGGFAGAFFATRQGFISPESFNFIESAVILAIVVLGGMGSQLGVVIAAAFLILIPELLRDFSQYRMIMFGLAMVLIMLWRPQGLVSHREPSIRLGAKA